MLLLDENIVEDQRLLLEKWKIRARQIGIQKFLKGIQDEQIISIMHRFRRTTFLTNDSGFYSNRYCHPSYGIAFFDVDAEETAFYIRKFLKHKLFNTMSKRLGKVAKVSQSLITYYTKPTGAIQQLKW